MSDDLKEQPQPEVKDILQRVDKFDDGSVVVTEETLRELYEQAKQQTIE